MCYRKCRIVYTINILNRVLVILYKSLILMLLEGFYGSNLHGYYGLYSMYSDIVVYVSRDQGIDNKCKEKESIIYSREYSSTNRSSYSYSTYTVQPGDTLYYIAWIVGNNYIDLARVNNIKNINMLQVGQILKVGPEINLLQSVKLANTIQYFISNCSCILKKILCSIKNKLFFIKKNQKIISDIDALSYKKLFHLEIPERAIRNNWNWPTSGKIINTFSDSERGNKGIDISGEFGQPILAATNGRVVYVGNILKGYGNLIIIKHADNYLTAYAHNDMICVVEQQIVQRGDQIATMGDSGTNETKLHFEIRHKGKSINPLYYLNKN